MLEYMYTTAYPGKVGGGDSTICWPLSTRVIETEQGQKPQNTGYERRGKLVVETH